MAAADHSDGEADRLHADADGSLPTSSGHQQKQGHMCRAAINTPIQGGAADIVMMAMLKIEKDERLKRLGFRMLMQIHDGRRETTDCW